MSDRVPLGYVFLEFSLARDDGEILLQKLRNDVEWTTHVFKMFGKEHVMPREIAFFGPFAYGYSGTIHPPRVLPNFLQDVMDRVAETAQCDFNTVLLNRYCDGSQSMGWHSDDDYEHGGFGAIASLSLGATRRFRIRDKESGESWGLDLEHGSLLFMSADSQKRTQHCLPKTRRQVGERLNLTFRHMAQSNCR